MGRPTVDGSSLGFRGRGPAAFFCGSMLLLFGNRPSPFGISILGSAIIFSSRSFQSKMFRLKPGVKYFMLSTAPLKAARAAIGGKPCIIGHYELGRGGWGLHTRVACAE